MKYQYIRSVVITIIGATSGMALAYFFAGSTSAGSLGSGALVGGLIGLYLGVSSAVLAGNRTSGGQSGISGMG